MQSPQLDVSIPQVRLPKGGGAIKGIGETFQASPFTGMGSFSIPIAVPIARGLEPDLALNYSSGASQGVFGLGFSLSIPNVTRRTEKRLPDYSEMDEFVLSNAEYLVPQLRQQGGEWAIDEETRLVQESGVRVPYRVRRYRTRTEGQFLLIERWTREGDGDVHWRVTTPDQLTSIYGRSPNARIVHPDHPLQVFSWLLEATEDDRGNRIQYRYRREDGVGVPQSLSEQNRLHASQVYLHQIQYGNQPDGSYSFSVVFDYGEYDLSNLEALSTVPTKRWTVRPDSFSDYRAGFEVRTHRLCRTILVFHHFPNELKAQDCLVRSLHLTYNESPVLSFLESVQYKGYQLSADSSQKEYEIQELPPLTFQYSSFDAAKHSFQRLTQETEKPLVNRFDDEIGYQFLDLYGEGISGLLYDRNGITLYWRPNGDGEFAAPDEPIAYPIERNQPSPNYRVSAGVRTRAMVRRGGRTGRYDRVDEDTWTGFQNFLLSPLDYGNSDAEYLDVTGDGNPDLLVFEEERIKVYPSLLADGHSAAISVLRSPDLPMRESQIPVEKVLFADMGGDGLSDRVRVRNGEVVYWPNLGYGKFGAKVSMAGAPHFGEGIDQTRIFLVDIDGSGTSDLVYVNSEAVWVYFNQSGNSFSEPVKIPLPGNYSPLNQIQFADIQGNGTSCLVFTQTLLETIHHWYDFTGGIKPHLLTEIDNHMGGIHRIRYAPSTRYYLADRKAEKPWLTELPFPVQVVEQVEQIDLIARSRRVSRFAYHHGAFEGREREFAGFGMIERWDTETFEQLIQSGTEANSRDRDLHVAPVYTKTWYHSGMAEQTGLSQQFSEEYYRKTALLGDSVFETPEVDPASIQEAYRALRGRMLREEVYGLDDDAKPEYLYTVQENNFSLRLMQPAIETPASVYMALPRESITHHAEFKLDGKTIYDPRITHRFFLKFDEYGQLTHSAELAYARTANADHPDQTRTQGKYTVEDYIHLTEAAYRLGIPAQTQVFELTGLDRTPYRWDDLNRAFPQPEQTAADFDRPSTGARLVSWRRYLYWNDAQSAVLPVGESGRRALLHHAETAMYPQSGLDDLLPANVPNMEGKLTSRDADGGAWITVQRSVGAQRVYYFNPGTVAVYGGSDRFYQAEQYIDAFGSITRVGYDPYRLLIVRTEARLNDRQSLVQEMQPDYRSLQPQRMQDINRNVTEYLYDPLGNVRVVSRYGQEGATVRGDRPLMEYQSVRLVGNESRDRILANPQDYIQRSTRFYFYDVNAWERDRQPVYALTLQREIYTSDLGNLPESPLQITVEYFDGLGRSVQLKQRAEAGKALSLGVDGNVSEVEAAERWITTGWTVYNNKGLIVKHFEPFYSNTSEYQDDSALTRQGVTTIRHYDPLGRVRRLDLPTGYINRTEYGAWDRRDYDANDSLPESPFYRAQTPSEQLKLDRQFAHYYNTYTREVYDGWGRTILQQDYPQASGNPLTTYSALDWMGNPLRLQDPRFFGSDRPNAEMQYDMEGRLLALKSSDSGTYHRLYSARGDEIQRWDGRGFRVSTEYDALARPIAVWVEQNGRRRQAERIEYGEADDPDGTNNLRGQVSQRHDQGGTVQFRRYSLDGDWSDSRRRFRTDYKTEPDWSRNEAIAAEEFATQRTFDALGRPAIVRMPDTRTIQQLYHPSGRVRSLLHRTANQAQSFISDIRYNARDQREQVVYGNTVTAIYEYDPKTFFLTRLASVRTGDRQVLQNISYSYDPAGNLTAIVDRSHRTVFGNNDVIEPQHTYGYDALYRLTQATGREHPGLHRNPRSHGLTDEAQFLSLQPNVNNSQALQNYSRSYTYDDSGNLTQIRHQASRTAFTRNILISANSNRGIVQQEAVSNADPEQAYDANGNLIQVEHLRAMRWNYRNQLTSVDVIQRSNGQNDSEYYVYSATGQRIRKVYERLVNGQIEVEETLYIGDYEVFRVGRGTQPSQERTSTHLSLGAEKIATVYRWTVRQTNDPEQQIRYRLGNHQGSVALELDERGNIVTYEEYYPYGGTALIASQSDREVKRKVYRYGGRERDAITQFYDYGLRYYIPWAGRWLNPDPDGFGDGLNLYQFVRGNPISFIDDGGTTHRRAFHLGAPMANSFSNSDTGGSASTTSGDRHLRMGRTVKQRPPLPQAWINAASGGSSGGSSSGGSSSGSSSSGASSGGGTSGAAPPIAQSVGGSAPGAAPANPSSSPVSGRSRSNAIVGSVPAAVQALRSGNGGGQSPAPNNSNPGGGAASQTKVPLTKGNRLELDVDMETAIQLATGVLVAMMFLKEQGKQSAASQPANKSDNDSTKSQGKSATTDSQKSDNAASSGEDDSTNDSQDNSNDAKSTASSLDDSDEEDDADESEAEDESLLEDEADSSAEESNENDDSDASTTSSAPASSPSSSSANATATQVERRQRSTTSSP